MKQEDRRQFWNTLCGLNGIDLQADREKLEKTIKYPRYIYRYREVSLSTIDALQRNLVFFSTADHYDDPFDTLLYIDFNRIREEGRKVLSSDRLEQQIKYATAIFPTESEKIAYSICSFVRNTDHEVIIDTVINYLKNNIQSLLRKRQWTACFTEDGNNETMWIKYADQYKGFCLVYDLQDLSKDLCGKQEKCMNCVVNNAGTSLYPVYYSDEGYDATEYAKSLLGVFMLSAIANSMQLPVEIINSFISSFPSQLWQAERVALIKSKCHEYDMEWRLSLCNDAEPPVMKNWIPYGVILGLRISEQDKKLVIRSSQMAGIEHIFCSFINDQYKLEHKEIEIR